MINKKIIFSLLFCISNIFWIQAYDPQASPLAALCMPVDQTITWVHPTQTESGLPANFYYNKSGEMVVCQVFDVFPTILSDANNFNQYQSSTVNNCGTNTNTIGNGQSSTVNNCDTNTNTIGNGQSSTVNNCGTNTYAVGNGKDGVNIPIVDALRFFKSTLKWLFGNHNTPIKILSTVQQIKKIGFKNPEKYNAIVKNGLSENAKKALLDEINKRYGTNLLQLCSQEDISLVKDLLEIDRILLENNRDGKYKICSDMWLIDFNKKTKIKALAKSEEALAINQAKIAILKDLSSATKCAKSNNNYSQKSYKTYMHDGIEKSGSEIILDVIFNKNFALTTDGLSPEQLIEKVGIKNDAIYKSCVQDKLTENAQKIYSKLTNTFRSKLASLSIEELKNLAKNINTRLGKCNKNEPILEKNRDQTLENYKEVHHCSEGRRRRIVLASFEEELAINTSKKIEYQSLSETIDTLTKAKEAEKENLEQKSNSANTQNQKYLSQQISINIDSNTTVKVPIDQIRNKSLEDAKIIAQQDFDTKDFKTDSANLETTEPTEKIIYFYDKHQQNIEERKVAAEKDIQTGGVCSTQNYFLDDNLKQALINLGIDPNNFTTVTGTASQQVTQQQLLKVGESIVANSHNLGQDLTALGLNFLDAANAFNAIGNIIKANGLVDCCYGIVTMAKNVVNGVFDLHNVINEFEKSLSNDLKNGLIKGVKKTIHSLLHLDELAKTTATDITKLILFMDRDEFEQIVVHGVNEQAEREKGAQFLNSIDLMGSRIEKYICERGFHGIVEDTIASSLYLYLSGKVLNVFGKFCANVPSKTIELVNNLKNVGLITKELTLDQLKAFYLYKLRDSYFMSFANGLKASPLNKACPLGNVGKTGNIIDMVETSEGIFEAVPSISLNSESKLPAIKTEITNAPNQIGTATTLTENSPKPVQNPNLSVPVDNLTESSKLPKPIEKGRVTTLDDGRFCIEHDGIDRTLAPNHGNPSTARAPRAWTLPTNREEQFAMQQVMSESNPDINGGIIIGEMSDIKNNWLAIDGWKKVTKSVTTYNNKLKQEIKIDIHYIWNKNTGEAKDFKFVDEKKTK